MAQKILYTLTLMLLLFAVIGLVQSMEVTQQFSNDQDSYQHHVTELEWEHYRNIYSDQYTAAISNSQPTEMTSLSKLIVINNEIINLARALTKNDTSDIAKVYSLHQFVHNISYIKTPGSMSSVTTLQNGYGDCLDKAILLSALLTSLNIDNYVILTRPEDYISHAFNVVNVDHTWLPVDPTTNFYSQTSYTMDTMYNSHETKKL